MHRREHSEPVGEDAVQDLVASASSAPSTSGPIFIHAISCMSDLDFEARQDSLRSSACSKWLSILNMCLPLSDVGRNILDLELVEDKHAEALNIIAAVIGVRSFQIL